MERSPALPLLPPCPLPYPIPQASVCGFGEGVNGSGASKGCKPRDHSCLLPPCSCIRGTGVTSDRLWIFIKIFIWSFSSPSSFGSNLPFQAPRLPCLCSAHLPVALHVLSHPSCVPTTWLHAHYPSACCLTRFTSPSPHLDRGDPGRGREHSCLLISHVTLWSFLVSSDVVLRVSLSC